MGCCCSAPTRSRDDDYLLPTHRTSTSRRASLASPLELLIVRDGQPINLILTEHGLTVVKRNEGSLHSLKLGQPSATSTRLIPYLNLLAITSSHAIPVSSSSSTHVSLAALVSSSKADSNAKTQLWTLDGEVHEVGPHGGSQDSAASASETGTGSDSDAERRRCAVDEWCREAEERAYTGVKRHRKLHVIVNPAGGKGKAKSIWQEAIQPVFEAAGSEFDVSYTGPPGSATHAVALGASHSPAAYDALVAVSGDGIVHELLNGLASQDGGRTGRKALRETPIVHVPSGSGNALAVNLLGPEKVTDVRWAALAALKGQPIPIDLCSVTQSGGKRLFSFLTQAFGLMADLDLGTEHLRWMGDTRFTYGYVQGALSRRTYPLTLHVKVENSSKASIAKAHNASLSRPAPPPPSPSLLDGPEADEIPPLEYGTPDDPLPTEGGGARHMERMPKDGELDARWWTVDLQEGVFFLYGGKLPFIAKDVMLFPPANPSDGLIDLCLVGPMSPLEALTAMDGADTGRTFSNPSTLYLKASAYRLSFPAAPKGRKGYVSIDGESMPHQAFAVEVHRALGRVMALGGRVAGRRRIDGYELGADASV
ncbi:SPOSA6832_01084, partial [Sporobolomyces salmonicolor]